LTNCTEHMEGVTLHSADCLEALPTMADGSVDSCVTDPPYHLTSIVKRFSKAKSENEPFANNNPSKQFGSLSRGFMGKQWDGGDIAFRVELWQEVFRVLKPGAHLVAFSGTRTYHRMVCAIEDAGFEIRDQIGWAYGSGFPKSHNQKGDWEGWGTALKPAWEPIVLARKPLIGTVAANVLAHGTGAINIDGCRVEAPDGLTSGGNKTSSPLHMDRDAGVNRIALRAEGHSLGRWPANIVHDGSDEVVGAFPDSAGQQGDVKGTEPSRTGENGIYGHYDRVSGFQARNDSGSAARFFYTAKADADDRLGSKHPTVKPIDLMQWLVRLVTPPGGTVLDPFAGTGTTGEAAFREGFRAILIEREPEYQNDIRRRMSLVLGGPDERRRASIKASGKTADAGPLFGGGL
jgi:site-specific DNA-methyltransferase (adenine-specific)